MSAAATDLVEARIEYSSDMRPTASILLETLNAFFLDLDDAKFRFAAVLEECRLPTHAEDKLVQPTSDNTETTTTTTPAKAADTTVENPLEGTPLAKHIVTLDEFTSLDARSMQQWQAAFFKRYTTVARLSPTVFLADAARWWGSPRLASAVVLFLVTPLLSAAKEDALRASALTRANDDRSFDNNIAAPVTGSPAQPIAPITSVSALRESIRAARAKAVSNNQATAFCLSVADPAADQFMAAQAKSETQATARPPSFATSMAILVAPEGVYCFRTPVVERLRHHGDNNQSTLCESFEGFDRVLDSLQALCPTDCESFTWTDEVNTAYSQVFHVDVGAAMHSDQRAVSVPQTIAPVLRVAEFGRVSPEVVIANQKALLFSTEKCWAPNCTQSTAYLARCSQCKVASFCSKECQKAIWPEHRDACRMYQELQATKAAIGMTQ